MQRHAQAQSAGGVTCSSRWDIRELVQCLAQCLAQRLAREPHVHRSRVSDHVCNEDYKRLNFSGSSRFPLNPFTPSLLLHEGFKMFDCHIDRGSVLDLALPSRRRGV